jgi:hypothetical protein
MRLFLDANMPRSAVTELGHQVEFSGDIGMANDRDEAIAAHARQTQAALVRLVRARRRGGAATTRTGRGQQADRANKSSASE